MSSFTVSEVLAWARTKPADLGYNYGDVSNCALCQFLVDTGRCVSPSVGGLTWADLAAKGSPSSEIPSGLRRSLISNTFGELVAKLEALEPDAVVTRSEWLSIDAYLTAEQVSA